MKKEESTSIQTEESEYKNRFDVKTLIAVMVLILITTVIVLWNPKFQQTVPARTVQAQEPLPSQQIGPRSGPDNNPARDMAGKATPVDDVTLEEYSTQTNWIVLGAVVIVLIITGGSLSVIQRKE